MKRSVWVLMVPVLVACTSLHGEDVPARQPSPPMAALADLVDRMKDAPPSAPPYRRAEFGPAWKDTDGNGCNQRDDVLMRDAIVTPQVRRTRTCDHDVVAGSWRDPYTGATLTFTNLKEPSQAQAIQIDHVVSLSDAWASGAASWTAERRLLFANDLGNLLAVDGPANHAKRDGRPPTWLPTVGVCDYLRTYLVTKISWGLGVPAAERQGLRDTAARCREA